MCGLVLLGVGTWSDGSGGVMPKKKRKPRNMNPVRKRLEELLEAGWSKEEMCVAAELKYPTLDNVFKKPRISYGNMRSLRYCGLISEEDETDYQRWVMENLP
jgi:hypothetical protein